MKTLWMILMLVLALILPGCAHRHHHSDSGPGDQPVTIDPPPSDQEEGRCHNPRHPHCKKCCKKKNCHKDHEHED